MARSFNPRWLLGRRIVAVEMNRRPARESKNDKSMTADPVIFLDNGACISFMPDETDWEPGVSVVYTAKARDPNPDAVKEG